MFHVIACPRCRRARVVDVGKKTTSCGSCGRELELAHLRAHHSGPSLDEARHAAGVLNARLAGREHEYLAALVPPAPRRPRHDDAFQAAAASSRRAASEADRADRVARALSQQVGEFGEDDLARALHLSGIARCARRRTSSACWRPRCSTSPAPGSTGRSEPAQEAALRLRRRICLRFSGSTPSMRSLRSAATAKMAP